MISTGLLPLMSLNLSKDGVGSLFVMDDSVFPEQMLQKLDNVDSTTIDYILENRVYCAQATPSIGIVGNEASLSLATPLLHYSGTVGKEFNQSFTSVNTPANASDTATVADFPNVLVYMPKNIIPGVSSYTRSNSTSLVIPIANISANTSIQSSFTPLSVHQLNTLVPNDPNDTLAFTMSEGYYGGGNQARGYVLEVNYKDAISPDILLFKCGLVSGASYSPRWSTWTLRIYYYNETTMEWIAVGGSHIPGPKLIAYQLSNISAKRFRMCIEGTFDSTSGSFNVATRLGLSKFAFGKKNTSVVEATHSPKTAIFFPSHSLIEQANYTRKFLQANSINAVVLTVGEGGAASIDLIDKADPFEDGTTIATLPLNSNIESTYKPVYASTLVDMENALTYVANNNYLGRKVINNDGVFTAHGPLNGAFSATMNAGAGRKWAIKDVVIKDNAVAVPPYPNNPKIRWYGSNDNITYTLLFTAAAATGQRIINLPSEVMYQYLKIEHDTHPSNNYALSVGVYTDNSVVIKAGVTATAVGTTAYVPGVFGNAIQGNGSYYMRTDLKLGPLSSWSISCHANKLKTGTGSIFGSSNGSGSIPKFMLTMDDRLEPGKIVLTGIDSTGARVTNSVNKLADDNFHHVAVVYSSGILSLYIDGEFKTSITIALAGLTGLLHFFQEGENYSIFSGAIDQVRIFSRALTAAELNHLKIEKIEFSGSGVPGELTFDSAFLSGQRVSLLPNSNKIGADI